MKILATDLVGKEVMSDDGLHLGRLRSVLVDERTGTLGAIRVEPTEDVDPRIFRRDEEGYMLFPFNTVKNVRDVVVVRTAAA